MKILNYDEFVNEGFSKFPTEKKAVKLYNIRWDLKNVDPEERSEIQQKLPKKKGFTVDSSFQVVSRVPAMLKKKYGYDIIDFSFTEYRIADTFEDLLTLSLEPSDTVRELYKSNGDLSAFGSDLYGVLLDKLSERFQLESEGKDESSMPKLLDEIMLSIENIFNVEWESTSITDLEELFDEYLESKIEKKSKKTKKVKPVEPEDEDEDEDEESYRAVDDEDVPDDVKEADARSREENDEIYFDKKTKRYYFKDSDYYMIQGSDGDFRVYDDGEYEGKYCGSIDMLMDEDDPLGYVLAGL